MNEIIIEARTAIGYTETFYLTKRGNMYTQKAKKLQNPDLFIFKTEKNRLKILDSVDIAKEIEKISDEKFIVYEIKE